MRHSREFPPAGYTRAAPAPPRRRPYRSRSSLPAVALAVVLAAGVVLTVGYGLLRPAPAHRVTPDAVPTIPSMPPPSAPSSATPSTPSAPAGSAPPASAPAGQPSPPGGSPVASQSREPGGRSGSAARPRPRAPRAPRGPRPRPAPRPSSHKAPAVPGPPAWVTAECRQRFPFDPGRQAACAAVLAGHFAR
ncbi:hypothetical protein [Actinomadura macra]|uniref:hypothetical protein n=1 Tax=Actinomadura macra TaxID=46164 RepID=UPI000836B774|nr:hypothetical protein [Actinomadura macra]